jgi:hypothetical protein
MGWVRRRNLRTAGDTQLQVFVSNERQEQIDCAAIESDEFHRCDPDQVLLLPVNENVAGRDLDRPRTCPFRVRYPRTIMRRLEIIVSYMVYPG